MFPNRCELLLENKKEMFPQLNAPYLTTVIKCVVFPEATHAYLKQNLQNELKRLKIEIVK